MSRIYTLITLIAVLASLITPITPALALAIPVNLEGVGSLSVSKSVVYIGPTAQIKLTIVDDDVYIEYNNTHSLKVVYPNNTLVSTAPDKVYALLQIIVGGNAIPADNIVLFNASNPNQTLAQVSNAWLIDLTETGNATYTFTRTLSIMPTNGNTTFDNATGRIYVNPADVAKGIVVKIMYPDLVVTPSGVNVTFINKTFEIKALAPTISIDKTRVLPGENFTITLEAVSLNLYADKTDYIEVDNATGDVYWVGAEAVKVGNLTIYIVMPNGTAKELSSVCAVNPVVKIGNYLLYEETGTNTSTYKIPIDGKCIRDLAANMGIALGEGYKINVTYYDLYTDKVYYVTLTVTTVKVVAEAYISNGTHNLFVAENLPVTIYQKYVDNKTADTVSLPYWINVTVTDPSYAYDKITVEIYDYLGNLNTSFTVNLQGTGDTRHAAFKVDFVLSSTKDSIVNMTFYNGTHTINVSMSNLLSPEGYVGKVVIKYGDVVIKELPVKKPADDTLGGEPATLEKVYYNITLRFATRDLPWIPGDLAIKVEWGTKYYYVSAEALGLSNETGEAIVNVNKVAEALGISNATLAQEWVGEKVKFSYTDPAAEFSTATSLEAYTTSLTVTIKSHTAELDVSATTVQPFGELNITITDPDLYFENCSFINTRLELTTSKFGTTGASTLADLNATVSGIATCVKMGESFVITLRLWKDVNNEFRDPAGDLMYIYFTDPASPMGPTSIIKTVEVKPVTGSIELEPSPYVNVSGKLVITVIDPDANRDPESKDTVTVYVYSDSYRVKKTVTMSETDVNSGVFTVTLVVTSDVAKRTDPRYIYAQPGDKIYVEYVDEYAEEGVNVTITKTVTVTAGPAVARLAYLYVNLTGESIDWFLERTDIGDVLVVNVPLAFPLNGTVDAAGYVLFFVETEPGKVEGVEVGSIISKSFTEGVTVIDNVYVATVDKIVELAKKYGVDRIYAYIYLKDKATGAKITKVFEFGTWWTGVPIKLTILVDLETGTVKDVLLGKVRA